MTNGTEIMDFESHMQRMEREAQQQAHDLAVEKERTKQRKLAARSETKEYLAWGALALLVVAVVAAIVVGIWYVTKGPDTDQQRRDEYRTECITNGGTFIPELGESDSGEGVDVCIAEGHELDQNNS